MKAIVNGRIITEKGLLFNKALIFNKKIIGIVPEDELLQYPVKDKIDAGGFFISPGFIDIHTHGAAGYDVMDGNENGLYAMSRKFASWGVTSFLATTMTMHVDAIKKALNTLEKVIEKEGTAILGCHLEGPFISSKYPGAQKVDDITDPDISLIDAYRKTIKMVTIAPELQGIQEFIRACADRNIVVSIGHSAATYEEAVNALNHGAKSVTHTFNAMTPLHHRDPGVVGAAMDVSDAYCELIADNIHVHPAVQRILLKAKGIDRIILVSDSMRAAGMSEGSYELGGQAVAVKDHRARLANGVLAGSILTINEALKNFRKNTGISIEDAVKTVTANPARLIGMEFKKGSLEANKDADIVIFDDEFNVHCTFCGGAQVFPSTVETTG